MLIYENGELQHTNTCIDIIEHSGVKGMKWGQRRAMNKNKKALDKARALHYRQYARHKANHWKYSDPSGLTVAEVSKNRKHNRLAGAATGVTAAVKLAANGFGRGPALGALGLTAAGLAASKLNEARITRKYNKLRAKDKQYLKKYDNPKVDKDIRDAYKHGRDYINRNSTVITFR